ncbi:hypothetical protein [Enterobacter soli]|uniref:hypothetical protein n=1 Tax=Enterobacter soli TaxID=885040 RepID=UPI004046D9D6
MNNIENVNVSETHYYYSNDFNVEEQDKEIWVDGKLAYTIHKGLEMEYDDAKQSDSPFYGLEILQTVYITNKGNIQFNNKDGSYYFFHSNGKMATYINGELMIEDPNGKFDDFIKFVNSL